MNRRNVIFGAAIVATVAVAAGVALAAAPRGPEPLAERVDPLLPDLVMAPINYVDGSFGGEGIRPYLRFGATISNIGAGDFILDIRRSGQSATTGWCGSGSRRRAAASRSG